VQENAFFDSRLSETTAQIKKIDAALAAMLAKRGRTGAQPASGE
jgi:chorismate mutase